MTAYAPRPLFGAQRLAADPAGHAALSASAGTGKTHVLTSRVMRLLLQGARPDAILCLTYTKAGAAEMANRIADTLSQWVQLDDAALGIALEALGEEPSLRRIETARRLFARVLEAPGGLRIQTLHSFCQSLLASFPVEAGMTPGFRAIEGRAVDELAERVLLRLLADAEAGDPRGLLDDMGRLSLRLGEAGVLSYLRACARPEAAEAIARLGPSDGFEAAIRAAMNLPAGEAGPLIQAACSDAVVPPATVGQILDAYRAWGKVSGDKVIDHLSRWQADDGAARVELLPVMLSGLITEKGTVTSKGPFKLDPSLGEAIEDFAEAIGRARSLAAGLRLAELQAAGLRAGAAFASAYRAAKARAGYAEFDDLIFAARRLFAAPEMGAWVRYKLDQRTDHVLVDEAQDTNADQWAIVGALVDDFFDGAGAMDRDRLRTLFLVGDYKQAIYGFQGTNPREFDRFRDLVAARVAALAGARQEGDEAGDGPALAPFRDLSIDASFRSAPAVLEVVDAVLTSLGPDSLGLRHPAPHHVAARVELPGTVEWWPPLVDEEAPDGADGGGDDDDAIDDGFVTAAQRAHADRIASYCAATLADPPAIGGDGRALGPGDIMILVRNRRQFARLIVARLHAHGVPVAGVDRLPLGQPIAVKDLLAALRFAAQPLDDLNLASLLVSPLIGLTHQRLEDLALGRRGSLWRRLRELQGDAADWGEAHARLGSLLTMADQVPPARFLETILSGPLAGRARLLARLGEAARDPIEALVATALEFEREAGGGLDQFLQWFDRAEVTVARDNDAPGTAVRVMTVHGSKGLEAPLVLLADATFDWTRSGQPDVHVDVPWATLDGATIPLLRPGKDERRAPFDTLHDSRQQEERAEHFRLLYVAMTRAAQKLVVTGVTPKRAHPDNWHQRIGEALVALGATADPADGGTVRWHGRTPRPLVPAAQRSVQGGASSAALPDWVRQPAPIEARPPRPLSPSQLGEDREVRVPPSPALRAAARRGALLHQLFERLPANRPAERSALADRYLVAQGVEDPAERSEMVGAVLAVIDDPAWQALFGPDALPEAPITATLGDGTVVAGTVDLLVIEADRVRVIDFKTGRSVPADVAALPPAHARQMAAYRDALAVIFPGRRIEASLLYTAGPRMLTLPH